MSGFSSNDDKLKGLMEHLNGYFEKTRNGKATGMDYNAATNFLREHYDNVLFHRMLKMT
jgi:hypothetical protein